jgi:hypothetical protein
MTRVLVIFVTLLLAGCGGVGADRPPPPSVDQIVALAKAGAPAADIIQRLRESGAVYALPASELARLREQGVPDPVIDYMQMTYLDAVRRDEAYRQFQREMMYWPPYYRYPFPPWW